MKPSGPVSKLPRIVITLAYVCFSVMLQKYGCVCVDMAIREPNILD